MIGWIDAVDRRAVSDLSGTLSFVVWLFAQSPQLYENYRRGSVDGLSPVFLTQWMLGDATNLIGCILTQQLPFQIAVATYFCCIDVCIMVQFVYYWTKARKERERRIKSRSRQRSGSLTSPYPPNPYSVLSETSELLAGRPSRHNSYLRSSSRRRNLSHSQQLAHPHRHNSHAAHAHDDPHAPLLPHASTDKPSEAPHADHHPQRPNYKSSRSRSRRPPLSRNGSTDTVSAVASGSSVANYRALSDAAMSVAQLAQEAARRREAMLHHSHGADDDYFSHHRPRSHRSKSRASSSPNHSQPPSHSRSRVNSNDQIRPDAPRSDLTASTRSMTPAGEAASSTSRRSRTARSMSSRNKASAANVDFVRSALSPTRETRDADDIEAATRPNAEEEEETEAESVSEAESGSRDESTAADALADSVSSLATVSTESSIDSVSVEPRGRDMVRMANRIDTAPASGAVIPLLSADMARESTSSPYSANSSSDGTARHPSPHPASRENTDRMSMSHHQLGRQSEAAEDSPVPLREKKSRKRRTHDSTRESLPAAPLHRSVDALATSSSALKDGSRKRTMTRSLSTRSHSKRMATGALIGMTASASSPSVKKRSGTKSPASMRRSIGMVLLGIMLITSLPSTSTAAIISASEPLLLAQLLEDAASWRRLVGRISAWLCALLYITSRIPQIWENHIRRSVAGISILLFIAAFSGNLLYTISVLANPSATGEGARTYLQESLPFLLGSGGTLVFDLIIVAQWLAWRNKSAVALV
ncbi:uncharacterized protein SRS1_12618 [Sporisorium reilianum f. sp. reilianum]|uniref:Vacuolar membrane protein n=1 Tax=Sporisorium reilianum f. sp. reilianum TaxID=72559 RepID=A0A2N8UBC4_9BASI|nr:uncharacterized protein SRS1_12618 [Sporisorium reilianum f. sp. reilianum]